MQNNEVWKEQATSKEYRFIEVQDYRPPFKGTCNNCTLRLDDKMCALAPCEGGYFVDSSMVQDVKTKELYNPEEKYKQLLKEQWFIELLNRLN